MRHSRIAQLRRQTRFVTSQEKYLYISLSKGNPQIVAHYTCHKTPPLKEELITGNSANQTCHLPTIRPSYF